MSRTAVAYIQSPAGRRTELIDRITSVRHHLVDMEMELQALEYDMAPAPVQTAQAVSEEWLTAKEIGRRLSVTPQCVCQLANRGELERCHVGRAVRYSADSLQRYMGRGTITQ